MNFEEARTLVDTNQELRAKLQRTSENLLIFERIDEAREITIQSLNQRLSLLKENLSIWAALLEAASAASEPDAQEAFRMLLDHHAAEMRRCSQCI
jgi:hypothetical protein